MTVFLVWYTVAWETSLEAVCTSREEAERVVDLKVTRSARPSSLSIDEVPLNTLLEDPPQL